MQTAWCFFKRVTEHIDHLCVPNKIQTNQKRSSVQINWQKLWQWNFILYLLQRCIGVWIQVNTIWIRNFVTSLVCWQSTVSKCFLEWVYIIFLRSATSATSKPMTLESSETRKINCWNICANFQPWINNHIFV